MTIMQHKYADVIDRAENEITQLYKFQYQTECYTAKQSE